MKCRCTVFSLSFSLVVHVSLQQIFVKGQLAKGQGHVTGQTSHVQQININDILIFVYHFVFSAFKNMSVNTFIKMK